MDTRPLNENTCMSLFQLIKYVMCQILTFLESSKSLNLLNTQGAQCLETHIKVYYSRMTKAIHDEKILINYFCESLVRHILSRYIGLNDFKMNTWK